jgi:hypothetical protein
MLVHRKLVKNLWKEKNGLLSWNNMHKKLAKLEYIHQIVYKLQYHTCPSHSKPTHIIIELQHHEDYAIV